MKYVTIPVSDELYDELLDGYEVGPGIVTLQLNKVEAEKYTHDLTVSVVSVDRSFLTPQLK